MTNVQPHAAPADSLWRGEIIDTVRLAVPIALTQLGQVAMMTSDLALVGRLGDHAVSAAALAQVVLFVGFVLGMGLVSAVARWRRRRSARGSRSWSVAHCASGYGRR
jgi:MATE family multidrug resistance protein